MRQTDEPLPKYQQVFAALEQNIRNGHWKQGDRVPSEAQLIRQFGASRITVGRAVRDLQLAGLVERRAGAGTFVRAPADRGLSFGLLIPDLGETEIFEPICQGIAASKLVREHALLWGSGGDAAIPKEDRTWELCRQFVDRKVAGVFFAPVEASPAKDEVNQRVVHALDRAGIPVVLLDRTVVPWPERGEHDLVAIDNRRAGYVVTAHLLSSGARRIAFVGLPNAASTVDARLAGWREALHRHGIVVDPALECRMDPAEPALVTRLMESLKPDGIVCANDATAARLLNSLLDLGLSVPGDVRLVGMDDVQYARLLPVPLTTLRQPTRAMGAAAMAAMLDRIRCPDLPPRDILLACDLVVRRSCGSAPESAA